MEIRLFSMPQCGWAHVVDLYPQGSEPTRIADEKGISLKPIMGQLSLLEILCPMAIYHYYVSFQVKCTTPEWEVIRNSDLPNIKIAKLTSFLSEDGFTYTIFMCTGTPWDIYSIAQKNKGIILNTLYTELVKKLKELGIQWQC